MNDQTAPSVHEAQQRGLATLALLKTYYDEHRDHVDMFTPFVIDAIKELQTDDFLTTDIKNILLTCHHIDIPVHILDVIVTRLWKRGEIKRQGGRYFRIAQVLPVTNLNEQRQKAENDQNELASSFCSFAKGHDVSLTNDDGLSLIFSFLDNFHVSLLLGEEQPKDVLSRMGDRKNQLMLVAKYIEYLSLSNDRQTIIFQKILEGFILQNTLLLRDINFDNKIFGDLEIFLDTRFIFSALGLSGNLPKRAARETIDLLRATNARLSVFQCTIAEMRRILDVYESNLGTCSGIERLRPTELTRYFVTNKYTPADVKELSSLLEVQIGALGMVVKESPVHETKFTLDEMKLADVLKTPGIERSDSLEPRVMHDVESVAAILTLRQGKISTNLDQARTIFATSSGMVIRKVREWYHEMGACGLPPVIHILALSNAAWIKNPLAATSLKLNELCALCSAALAPSRRTWEQFINHLHKLRQRNAMSDGEVIAIVASSLTDTLLSQIEDDVPIDAETLQEVVDRVKEDYAKEALSQVQSVAKDAHLQREKDALIINTTSANLKDETKKRQKLELSIIGRARYIARLIAWVPFLFVVAIASIGIILSLPGLLPSKGWIFYFAYFATLVAAFLGILNLICKSHLHDLRLKLENRISNYIQYLFMGNC